MQAPEAAGGSHAAPGGSFQPSTGAVAAPAGPVIVGPPGTIPPGAGVPGAGGAPGAGGGVAGGVAGASPVMQAMPGGMQHMQPYMIPPMGPDVHGMYYPGNGYIPHYYYDYSMPGYADPPRMPPEQWEEYMRMAARMDGGAGMMDGQQPPPGFGFHVPHYPHPHMPPGAHPSMMGAHMFGAPPPGYPFQGPPMFQPPLLRPPSPGGGPMFQLPLLRPPLPGDPAQPGDSAQSAAASAHIRPNPAQPGDSSQPGAASAHIRPGAAAGAIGEPIGAAAAAAAAAAGAGAGAAGGAGGAMGAAVAAGGARGGITLRPDEYNRADFKTSYEAARFFVIKSYSEDDVHKSIKYGVWASTPTGNKRLDAAFKDAAGKSSATPCPVFLFFSQGRDDVHKSIKYGVWASFPTGNKRLDAPKDAAGKSSATPCPVFLFFSVSSVFVHVPPSTSQPPLGVRFFVIKSFSEDDVHKSIKYGVWASTPTGNKRLDAAFKDAAGKSSATPCPAFLFFSGIAFYPGEREWAVLWGGGDADPSGLHSHTLSFLPFPFPPSFPLSPLSRSLLSPSLFQVNASGQFCGVAEMLTPVDFTRSVDYWQQDKWNGPSHPTLTSLRALLFPPLSLPSVPFPLLPLCLSLSLPLPWQVNASGQFCGVAEMLTPVDFTRSVDYWQQDKWNGHFQVKWHVIKDVPNSQFRHIIIASNDGKPVTNSRDTQEVRRGAAAAGQEMLRLSKGYLFQGFTLSPHSPLSSYPPGAALVGAGDAAAVLLQQGQEMRRLFKGYSSSVAHVPLQQGQEMLRLFKGYSSPRCTLHCLLILPDSLVLSPRPPPSSPLPPGAAAAGAGDATAVQGLLVSTVPLQQGQEMLRLFKGYSSPRCTLHCLLILPDSLVLSPRPPPSSPLPPGAAAAGAGDATAVQGLLVSTVPLQQGQEMLRLFKGYSSPRCTLHCLLILPDSLVLSPRLPPSSPLPPGAAAAGAGDATAVQGLLVSTVPLQQGQEMLRLFKGYSSPRCTLHCLLILPDSLVLSPRPPPSSPLPPGAAAAGAGDATAVQGLFVPHVHSGRLYLLRLAPARHAGAEDPPPLPPNHLLNHPCSSSSSPLFLLSPSFPPLPLFSSSPPLFLLSPSFPPLPLFSSSPPLFLLSPSFPPLPPLDVCPSPCCSVSPFSPLFPLQVPLQQGQEMLRLFKGYSSRTSILDDFTFYDSRQRAMQERKTRHPSHPFPHQQQSQHLQQHQQQQQQQQQHPQQQHQHPHQQQLQSQQQQLQHQHMQQQQHQQHQQQLQQQRRIVVGRNPGPVLLPQVFLVPVVSLPYPPHLKFLLPPPLPLPSRSPYHSPSSSPSPAFRFPPFPPLPSLPDSPPSSTPLPSRLPSSHLSCLSIPSTLPLFLLSLSLPPCNTDLATTSLFPTFPSSIPITLSLCSPAPLFPCSLAPFLPCPAVPSTPRFSPPWLDARLLDPPFPPLMPLNPAFGPAGLPLPTNAAAGPRLD
ncbi:unnamed protein product [Closterium sp. NIES-65]|nr:unnamed protein product [Closterium sp. NIES-65]